MRDVLVIGGAAAAGTYISQKWGGALEQQAVKFHVPPMLAHMMVVGGFTAVSYFLVRKIL
jgi:hypothetical protein